MTHISVLFNAYFAYYTERNNDDGHFPEDIFERMNVLVGQSRVELTRQYTRMVVIVLFYRLRQVCHMDNGRKINDQACTVLKLYGVKFNNILRVISSN